MEQPQIGCHGFRSADCLKVWWESGGPTRVYYRVPSQPAEARAFFRKLLQQGNYDPADLDNRVNSLAECHQRLQKVEAASQNLHRINASLATLMAGPNLAFPAPKRYPWRPIMREH
jgi:hypothetical protein